MKGPEGSRHSYEFNDLSALYNTLIRELRTGKRSREKRRPVCVRSPIGNEILIGFCLWTASRGRHDLSGTLHAGKQQINKRNLANRKIRNRRPIENYRKFDLFWKFTKKKQGPALWCSGALRRSSGAPERTMKATTKPATQGQPEPPTTMKNIPATKATASTHPSSIHPPMTSRTKNGRQTAGFRMNYGHRSM